MTENASDEDGAERDRVEGESLAGASKSAFRQRTHDLTGMVGMLLVANVIDHTDPRKVPPRA